MYFLNDTYNLSLLKVKSNEIMQRGVKKLVGSERIELSIFAMSRRRHNP
jgi:hypothetical protein